jgi:hypothetical protein
LAAVPGSEFCAPVARPGQSERAHEDELLDLLQQVRGAGGVSCGARTSSSVSVPPLRLDASLLCSARVFAGDRANTHPQSLTDSLGRNMQMLMAFAGYAQRYWAEVFSLDEASPSGALATLLFPSDLRSRLVDVSYVDVGLVR